MESWAYGNWPNFQDRQYRNKRGEEGEPQKFAVPAPVERALRQVIQWSDCFLGLPLAEN